MDLRVRRDIELSIPEVSELTRVSARTARTWITSGKLKSYKNNHNHYRVNLLDLIRFLKKNPKYCNYISEAAQDAGKLKYAKSAIIASLDNSPKLYTIDDLTKRLGVVYRTVQQWMEKGWLEPLNYKPAHGGYLFTQKAIDDFLNRRPKYKFYWNV